MAIKRPAFLGVRGRAMWADLAEHLGPTHRVVLEEACRIADRLDKLDSLLRGDVDTWARVRESDDGEPAELVIDNALAHARMLATTLRTLVHECVEAAGDAPEVKVEASTSDDLRTRRAQRLAKAAVS